MGVFVSSYADLLPKITFIEYNDSNNNLTTFLKTVFGKSLNIPRNKVATKTKIIIIFKLSLYPRGNSYSQTFSSECFLGNGEGYWKLFYS